MFSKLLFTVNLSYPKKGKNCGLKFEQENNFTIQTILGSVRTFEKTVDVFSHKNNKRVEHNLVQHSTENCRFTTTDSVTRKEFR